MRLTQKHLQELGFQFVRKSHKEIYFYTKARIEVRWHQTHIAVKPRNCSCILVQRPEITKTDFENFLKFMQDV